MAELLMTILGIWFLLVFPAGVRSDNSTLYWSMGLLSGSRLYRLKGDLDAYVSQVTNNNTAIITDYRTFYSSVSALGSDYYQPTQTVYCQDKQSGDLIRLYANTQNTNKFYRGLSALVKDIAVDWISKNLYFTDPLFGIGLVSYAAEWYTIIQQRPGKSSLFGIDVDPIEGYLFYADSEEGVIYRSALTGHNETRIVTNSQKPTLLVADVNTKSLYWIDVWSEILVTSDYRGNYQRSIWSSYEISADFFSAMAIYNDYVFLPNRTGGSIDVRNKTDGDFVASLTVASELFGYMSSYGLAIVSPVTQPFPKDSTITGGCPIANGDCSHICVSGGLHTPSQCLCQFGYLLRKDGRSCQAQLLLDDFLLFTDASGETIYQMNPVSSEVRIVPTGSLSNATPQGVTYDPLEQYVYWTEVKLHLIRRKSLVKSEVERTFYSQSQTSSTQALAIDVTGRGLYYTDSGLKVIGRLDLDTMQHQIILTVSKSEKPFQIQLDHQERYMYWSDLAAKTIEKANMTDGSKREIIVSSGLYQPVGLAVDVIDRRLYWADSVTKKVEVANLDGTNRKLLMKLPTEYKPHALTIDQYFVYVTLKRGIMKIGKADGVAVLLGAPFFHNLFGIHYYSSKWPGRTKATLLAVGLIVAGVVVIAVVVGVIFAMVTRKVNIKKCDDSKKSMQSDPSTEDVYPTTAASVPMDTQLSASNVRGHYDEIRNVVLHAGTVSQNLTTRTEAISNPSAKFIIQQFEMKLKIIDPSPMAAHTGRDPAPCTMGNCQGRNIDEYLPTTNSQSSNIEDGYLTTAVSHPTA